MEGKQTLSLEGRNSLRAEGVEKVEFFSSEAVSALSSLGRIVIKGKELFIDSLDKERHILVISGRIDQIAYSDSPGATGLFKKLFR